MSLAATFVTCILLLNVSNSHPRKPHGKRGGQHQRNSGAINPSVTISPYHQPHAGLQYITHDEEWKTIIGGLRQATKPPDVVYEFLLWALVHEKMLEATNAAKYLKTNTSENPMSFEEYLNFAATLFPANPNAIALIINHLRSESYHILSLGTLLRDVIYNHSNAVLEQILQIDFDLNAQAPPDKPGMFLYIGP